ncbi:hypothetical protein, partial [Streptococcus suis]|uniref:hypothetical protein n=1 Tax=Streptococcus suis TaxID=1307 RepID=UPI001EE6BFCB
RATTEFFAPLTVTDPFSVFPPLITIFLILAFTFLICLKRHTFHFTIMGGKMLVILYIKKQEASLSPVLKIFLVDLL